jgi:hypothetical protein
MEKAIEDMVWKSSTLDDCLKWIRNLPPYSSFNNKDIQLYAIQKRQEQSVIIDKIRQIQNFIQQDEMRMSLEPLLIHRRWLYLMYTNVGSAAVIAGCRDET